MIIEESVAVGRLGLEALLTRLDLLDVSKAAAVVKVLERNPIFGSVDSVVDDLIDDCLVDLALLGILWKGDNASGEIYIDEMVIIVSNDTRGGGDDHAAENSENNAEGDSGNAVVAAANGEKENQED